MDRKGRRFIESHGRFEWIIYLLYTILFYLLNLTLVSLSSSSSCLYYSMTLSLFHTKNMIGRPGSKMCCQPIPTMTILSYLIPKLFIFLIAIGSSMTIYMILISNFHTQIEFGQVVLMTDNHSHSEPKRPFHVAMTASKGLYGKWQCRIAYYWYKKVRDLPGSEMGGFTRILHSGESDDLVDEIPTFVVKPLPSDQEQVIFFD